jgi:hypothetical protein
LRPENGGFRHSSRRKAALRRQRSQVRILSGAPNPPPLQNKAGRRIRDAALHLQVANQLDDS